MVFILMSDPNVVLRLKKKKNDFVNIILYAPKATFFLLLLSGQQSIREFVCPRNFIHPHSHKISVMVSVTKIK